MSFFRRYRGEFGLIALCAALITSYGIVQRNVLQQPAEEPGATSENFVRFVGVPLDDVYIHCRFAANLLHGNGYCFNPGEPVTADTSPLWISLLAIAGFAGADLPSAAIFLSALCYTILTVGVYRAAKDLFGFGNRQAFLAGILTALSSRLLWSAMSGMETALAALLMFLTIEEHERNRQRGSIRWREGFWLGLGIATRPEFWFVAIVLTIDLLSLRRHINLSRRSIVAAIAVFALLALPTLLLPLTIEGTLVSHSSIVQGAAARLIPNVAYLWFTAKVLASNNIILFGLLLALLSPIVRDRRFRILTIVALGLPILQAFIAPQFRHHGRYFFPIIPLLVLGGVKAFELLGERRTLRLVLTGAAVIAGLIETGRWSRLEAESVRNINDQHLAATRFLRTTLGPSDRIAADDVGAVGYYLNRPIIDLTGLVSPRTWPLQHDQRLVWQESRREGANVYLIYDRLNPAFYESIHDSLVLIREFRIRKPLVSAADTVMSFYRVRDVH